MLTRIAVVALYIGQVHMFKSMPSLALEVRRSCLGERKEIKSKTLTNRFKGSKEVKHFIMRQTQRGYR